MMNDRLFPAQYYGSCSHCMEPIEPGDWVGYVDDEIACELCVEEDS